MADPDLIPFLEAAVGVSVTDPVRLEIGPAAAEGGVRAAGSDALDQALFRNAQEIADELVLVVADHRLERLAGLLELLLQNRGEGEPLYEDDQVLFVLVTFEIAAGEALMEALARLTAPPHDTAGVHSRLSGLKSRLVMRVFAILTSQEEVGQMGGPEQGGGAGLPTPIGPKATTAADWLPLDRLLDEPLAGPEGAGAEEPGFPQMPGREKIMGGTLTPEEMHGRLVNLRGFTDVPHAAEIERLKVQGEIDKSKKRIRELQKEEAADTLSSERQRLEIEKERANIEKNENKLPKKSDVPALERARLEYDKARMALENDPTNANKKKKLKAARDRMTLYDPHFHSEGGDLGMGKSTFVVMQLEIPGEPPIIAEGNYTSKASHAETEALLYLNKHLDRTYDLEDPAVKERIAKGKLTVMPDQIVCSDKCRPDIAQFAERTGISDIQAVYVVRQAKNRPLDVPLGEVAVEPAENKEAALKNEFKKRGLATAKTAVRTAASGKETLKNLPQFVVTEDLLSNDLKVYYRPFESNLPTPPPGAGRRPPGQAAPTVPNATDVPDSAEPPKVRFRRLKKALMTFGRALVFVFRTVLTALEFLEPLLVFAEGLDAALGQRPADLYRKKVAGLNRDLRRQIVHLRQSENAAKQVSAELLGFHFGAGLDAATERERLELLKQLKTLETESYGAMLSLLSRRDLARQSGREAEAQEKVAYQFLFTRDRKLQVLFGSQDAGGYPLIFSAHQALIKLRPVLREHVQLLDEMIRLVNIDYLSFRSWFALLAGEGSHVQIPDALLQPAVSDAKLRLPPAN
jgi:hypothetical protein